MKVKISELTGAALDWAVAKCEGRGIEFDDPRDPWLTRDGISDQPLHSYTPSTDWAQSGPIIEREIFKLFRNVGGRFTAQIKKRVPYYSPTYDADIGRDEVMSVSGETPLIAAMRCYVASKLGDEVELPTELTPNAALI